MGTNCLPLPAGHFQLRCLTCGCPLPVLLGLQVA
jgi:hypothetical protein